MIGMAAASHRFTSCGHGMFPRRILDRHVFRLLCFRCKFLAQRRNAGFQCVPLTLQLTFLALDFPVGAPGLPRFPRFLGQREDP